MDPICHTLVGAALAETGLKRRSRLASATLIIGANLPDLDVLSYFWGSVAALGFRRGWTHGLPALLVLPLLLVGVMILWDAVVRLRRPDVGPIHVSQLVLLAYAAVATHPLLDFTNVYGMRWLMPLVDRWWYADVLFIVDPWIWTILVGGIYVSRQWARRDAGKWGRPALLALWIVGGYIGLMAAAAYGARRLVAAELEHHGIGRSARFMVAPVPVNPFRRLVVIDDGTIYRLGTFDWLASPKLVIHDVSIAQSNDYPDARRAAATWRGRTFLRWARFPFFVFANRGDSSVVFIVDARYTVDVDAAFGSVAVALIEDP